MKTLISGEQSFCSFCGTKLEEVFVEGDINSRVRCVNWGKRKPYKNWLDSILNYHPLNFDHDWFIGISKRKPSYNSITGERLK